MSPDIFAGDGKSRALLPGIVFILAATTLIVYSPALIGSPLFDESFLLGWLSHCIKTGLTASDTTAFLLAPPADPRDGLTLFGSAYTLIIGLFTGVTYSLMRYFQVFLHLINAILIFASVYFCLAPSTQAPRAIALGAVTGLYFCLFPLAPETVSWIFGLPIEAATTSMLAAALFLLWPTEQNEEGKDNSPKSFLLLAAIVLGALAPWLSLKAALLVLFPLILLPLRYGKKALQGPLLIALALMVLSSIPAEILNVCNREAKPETIKQLTIEKIALTGERESSKLDFLENGPGANLQALILPVNRKIDEKYNKVLRFLYIFLPLPVLLFFAAVLTGQSFRLLGPATLAAVIIAALNAHGNINSESFYGARWLYPVLPLACLLWALLCLSPLFIETGKRVNSSSETAERLIKLGLCVIFIFSLSIFFFQRTYRQNLSYRSNGRLWKVIKESIMIAGQKQTSPFIIVRNLPQTLSIAPILSPFSPQLIDTQSGLPRTASLSAGRLKDCLRKGKYTGLALHYEKTYNGFAATDLKIIDDPFGPELNAVQIAKKLSPPLIYYNGAVKLSDDKSTLLMESHTRIGPALRMETYGLSPIDGDFLYVDAKIDVPQGLRTNSPALLEMHWLTNWQGDWEARDRRVVTSGPVCDGQFHRYYFPLRTLAWTTSGLPTNIMLGFPGGATVALKSVGLCTEPVLIPEISLAAVHKADNNKNYFSHYCFNYPDIEGLGLCAVYGHDNGLDINFDVSKIADATEAIIEIVPLSEAFRNENSLEPLVESLRITSNQTKGNLKVPSEKLGEGGLFSLRVFGADADHKLVGHSSDSLKCLVDQRL